MVTFRIENALTEAVTTVTTGQSLPSIRERGVDPILARRGAAFEFDIFISGQSFKDIGVNDLVISIEVSLHEDKADFAKVLIRNEDSKLEKEAIFAEGKILQIVAGYQLIGQSVELGRFVIQKPRFIFSGEGSFIELMGLGEEVLLAETERRRLWTNIKDSEIAIILADEYGLETRIEDTEVVYERIVQACVSDWEFLLSRASVNGFQLFMRNGVLHFHPVEFNDTDVEINIRTENANAFIFEAEIDRYQGAPLIESTKINPLTGGLILVKSGFTPDQLFSNETKNTFIGRVRNAQTLSGGPRKYFYPLNSQISAESVKKEVQSAADANRFIVRASTSAPAVEILRPNDLITVNGIKRFNGKYGIREVFFKLSPATAFKMELQLRRTFTGEVEDSTASQDVTANSAISGVVVDGEIIELSSVNAVSGARKKVQLSPTQLSKLRQANLSVPSVNQNALIASINTSKTLNQAPSDVTAIGSSNLTTLEGEARDKKLREKGKVQFFDLVLEERSLKEFRNKNLDT